MVMGNCLLSSGSFVPDLVKHWAQSISRNGKYSGTQGQDSLTEFLRVKLSNS